MITFLICNLGYLELKLLSSAFKMDYYFVNLFYEYKLGFIFDKRFESGQTWVTRQVRLAWQFVITRLTHYLEIIYYLKLLNNIYKLDFKRELNRLILIGLYYLLVVFVCALDCLFTTCLLCQSYVVSSTLQSQGLILIIILFVQTRLLFVLQRRTRVNCLPVFHADQQAVSLYLLFTALLSKLLF